MSDGLPASERIRCVGDGGPAYPVTVQNDTGRNATILGHLTPPGYQATALGLTKREAFAMAAMQAIVSQASVYARVNPRGDFVADDCLLQQWNAPQLAAKTAVQFADALLAELAK